MYFVVHGFLADFQFAFVVSFFLRLYSRFNKVSDAARLLTFQKGVVREARDLKLAIIRCVELQNLASRSNEVVVLNQSC